MLTNEWLVLTVSSHVCECWLLSIIQVVLRVLTRVLREGQDYDMGSWETGTAVLDVCNTLMRHHETSGILKGTHLFIGNVSTLRNTVHMRCTADM